MQEQERNLVGPLVLSRTDGRGFCRSGIMPRCYGVEPLSGLAKCPVRLYLEELSTAAVYRPSQRQP